jgi:general secretion pathway protein G
MKRKFRSILIPAVIACQATACGTFTRLASSRRIPELQIAEFESAIQSFQKDILRYPTTAEGLDARMHNPGNLKSWKGPYLNHDIPQDPWFHSYIYKCPGDHGLFNLYSCGHDGVEGTDDDIVNWKKSR